MPAAPPDNSRLLPNFNLFLFAGNRTCWALTGPCVGACPLTANWQTTTMAQAAIAAQVHQTLDVHGNCPAKITFNHKVTIDHLTNLTYFHVAQFVDPTRPINIDLLANLLGMMAPDAMNVGQRNFDAFIRWYIYTGNTSQYLSP
jgi:hypothetical protein